MDFFALMRGEQPQLGRDPTWDEDLCSLRYPLPPLPNDHMNDHQVR